MAAAFTIRTNLLPPLALFIISPIVAEILIGSTPMSRFSDFLISIGLYGSGALLVREVTRSLHLGWPSIFALGLAFGIVEEGIALQSFFNPNSFGLDISFGRKYEVNWVWALFITVFHAFWSILIPIKLTETIFYLSRSTPWLNTKVLFVVAGLYLGMVFYYYRLFRYFTDFVAPTAQYFLSLTVVLLLVMAALRLPEQIASVVAWRPPKVVMLGVISVLIVLGWFVGFTAIFIEASFISPELALSICLGLVALLITLTVHWSNSDSWTPLHFFSIVFGALIVEMLYGALVLSESNKNLDRISHGVLSIVVILGLLYLTRKAKFHDRPA